MVFRHLLLGFGGSAAIGGIGYGIYSSSQSNSEEGVKTSVQEQGKSQNSDGNEENGAEKTEKEQTSSGTQAADSSVNTGNAGTGDDQASADSSPTQTDSTAQNKDQETTPQPGSGSQ